MHLENHVTNMKYKKRINTEWIEKLYENAWKYR